MRLSWEVTNLHLINTDDLLKKWDKTSTRGRTEFDQVIMEQPTYFDMDTVLDQLEDCGKYKGILKLDNDSCENYISVSVAKQIVKGRGLGGVLGYLKENKEEVKDCSTCKNNVEYPPPHTCDICTSLDQEEEYEMWEER